jgi:3-mercaptopyruvate sulfurtransferase SseA
MLARFVLGLYGYGNTELLEGHMKDWKEAGRPLQS